MDRRALPGAARQDSPADIVQRQLEAYNAHHLEDFLATYSEAIRIFRMPAQEPAIDGKSALAEFYATRRFNLPALRAEILGRIEIGDKVIDHERVHGLAPDPVEVAAVYEVWGGLIQSVWFFAPQDG